MTFCDNLHNPTSTPLQFILIKPQVVVCGLDECGDATIIYYDGRNLCFFRVKIPSNNAQVVLLGCQRVGYMKNALVGVLTEWLILLC